jgi:hypothetical protein
MAAPSSLNSFKKYKSIDIKISIFDGLNTDIHSLFFPYYFWRRSSFDIQGLKQKTIKFATKMLIAKTTRGPNSS